MTGHKKQRGWRGLEEYGEIERVRPQHLPRVTTSPQGVLTTAVLAVPYSACLTSTHRAGPRHTAAEDTFRCKEENRAWWDVKSDVNLCSFPSFFACLLLHLFLFYTPLFFILRLLFLSVLLCRIRAAKWKQQFSQKNFLITRNRFCKVSWGNKSFFGQFLRTPQQNKWRHKHIL